MKTIKLLIISLKIPLHRIVHDLGREIVVGLSSVILAAVFLYVFHDFLNVQVMELSTEMRDRFAEALAWAILALGSAIAAKIIHGDRSPRGSLASMAKTLGENPATIHRFLIARAILVISTVHLCAWATAATWLKPPEGSTAMVAACLFVAASSLLGMLGIGRKNVPTAIEGEKTAPSAADTVTTETADDERQSQASHTPPKESPGTASSALFRWRMRLILHRSRLARVCLTGTLFFLTLGLWAGLAGAPLFVAAASVLAASLWCGFAMSFQVAEDLQHAWLERALGISHEQYLKAYNQIGAVLGGCLALGAAGASCVASWIRGEPVDATAAMTLALIGSVAPLCAPSLLFQVDARRPAVTILVLTLVALFVGTAVLAHWLAWILVPIVRHFAATTQLGRFYRA